MWSLVFGQFGKMLFGVTMARWWGARPEARLVWVNIWRSLWKQILNYCRREGLAGVEAWEPGAVKKVLLWMWTRFGREWIRLRWSARDGKWRG